MCPSNPSKEFNHLFLEAVDEALLILGDESVTKAFYYHLMKKGKIDRSEIPDKIGEFHRALRALFNDGTIILEKRISKNLYRNLNLELRENKRWTLMDYVYDAKSRFESFVAASNTK